MQTATDLLDSVLKIDIIYQMELALIDSSEEYVRLQNEQMSKGQREDGKPIFNVKTGGDEYSPGYAKKKGKKKPIDLRNKGDFYEGTFLTVEDQKMIIDSADQKSKKLQEDYGEEIFGLNDESKIKFLPIAQDHLINSVANQYT